MNDALQSLLDEINKNPLFQLDTGPIGPDWQRLDDAVQGDWLMHRVQTFADDYPGLDQRGQGAFLVGRMAYIVATVLAAFDLTVQQTPALTPSTLWLRESNGRLHLRLASTQFQPSVTDAVRIQLIGLMETFIRPVKIATRLSAAAQWRLVSDSVAVGWQLVGRKLNQESRAQARAMDILTGQPSPLNNPQTEFTQVSVWIPGADQQPVRVDQSYRVRGGCCRLYTADDRDYCATCVLLKPDEQKKRLQTTLRQACSA